MVAWSAAALVWFVVAGEGDGAFGGGGGLSLARILGLVPGRGVVFQFFLLLVSGGRGGWWVPLWRVWMVMALRLVVGNASGNGGVDAASAHASGGGSRDTVAAAALVGVVVTG